MSIQKKGLKKGLFNYGHDIVMAFSPPALGGLVKKGLQKGGHEHPRTPPWLRPNQHVKEGWNEDE